MKKIIFLLALVFAFVNTSKAQNLIAVEHGSTSTFYTNLDTAITYAVDGDNIFIPGGSFDLTIIINKPIHIYGVGYNEDSTIATNITKINGDLRLNSNANGCSLIGLNVCGYLNFGTSSLSQNISNVKVNRCNLGVINLGYSGISAANYNIFVENVIGAINGFSVQNNFFGNNIIGLINNFSFNNTFKNNIFLGAFSLCSSGGAGGSMTNLNNCVIENNIIFSQFGLNNNIINNNLFIPNYNFQSSTNVGLNNIVNQAQSTIFVYQTGSLFDKSHNYNLKSSCLGKNAGTDGTDIGIYGSAFPWKDGALPATPNIQWKNIKNKTDANGNVPIQIKVKSQDN